MIVFLLLIPILTVIGFYACFLEINRLKSSIQAHKSMINDNQTDILSADIITLRNRVVVLEHSKNKTIERLESVQDSVNEIDIILDDLVSQEEFKQLKDDCFDKQFDLTQLIKKYIDQKKPQARKPRVKKDQPSVSKRLPAS